jgi:hypothetical protein
MAVCLWAGCRSPEPAEKARSIVPAPSKGGQLVAAPEPVVTVSTNTTEPAPIVLPASGRVHSVNLGRRFVVLDYTLGGMPPLESRLNVYRNGQKVAELRLSGPERNGFVAADILDGFVQVDDEVRLH